MIYGKKIKLPPSDDAFTAYWKKDLEAINTSIFPKFIYICVFGILLFTFFDYYSTPNIWFSLFILRVMIGVFVLALLVLVKSGTISLSTGIIASMGVVYVFLSFIASL